MKGLQGKNEFRKEYSSAQMKILERLAEIERLKQEKEEAQREYFLKQQELLTQIRDALSK